MTGRRRQQWGLALGLTVLTGLAAPPAPAVAAIGMPAVAGAPLADGSGPTPAGVVLARVHGANHFDRYRRGHGTFHHHRFHR